MPNPSGIGGQKLAEMEFFRYSASEIDYLKQQDDHLAQAIERIGWIERPVISDLFTALVSSIVHQQISNKAAATVWSRVLQRVVSITPQAVMAVPVEEIQQLGMSMRKAGYITSIADAVARGELDLNELHALPDVEVIERLSAQPGIGVWTAEMLMIFCMQRPDVVSWHDLAIRRGMMNLYGLNELKRPQFDAYRQRYSPYGSVASLYLWQISKE
ncbi:MAG TPA: DNA-3-methyladenine glycosylase [Bellilinea sp.]|nr:DNA-3-methyladenine glycosylase [Bellilinea sp.]